MKINQQPRIIEAEYYPDGNQKRYYSEKAYPQFLQLIIGMSALIIAISTTTIMVQNNDSARTSRFTECSYQQKSQSGYQRRW